MVCLTPPGDSTVLSKRNKLIGLLVAAWLVAGFVSVAQADFDDGLAPIQCGDYVNAFRDFKPLAKQGEIKALYNLGLMYVKGDGIPRDYVLAHMWLELAATQGFDYAI